MGLRIELLPYLLALSAASFACRAGGFWLMRFVRVTPRMKAALDAAPLAVMIGIVAPAAARGQVPELLALAAIVLLTRLTGSEVVAALSGVAVVALGRGAGW